MKNRTFTIEHIEQFIDDSMLNFIQINEEKKFNVFFEIKELTGMRAFHKFLIDQLEEAKKMEEK